MTDLSTAEDAKPAVMPTTLRTVMPICGDDYPLTEKQQKLMALARQLGR